MMFLGLLGQGVASVTPCRSSHVEQHDCSGKKNADHCCSGEDSSIPCDDQCPDTPHHHHHHGACCHAMPSWIAPDVIGLSAAYGETRVVLHATDDVVPEGPVRALDKPPLI